MSALQGRFWSRVARVVEPEPVEQNSYRAIALDRLCFHAARILDVDQVCVVVRERRGEQPLVPVAGYGVDDDLIGQRLSDPRLATLAMNLDTPLALPATAAVESIHGGGEVCAAAIAPVSAGGEARGALSIARGRPGPGFELDDLSLLGNLVDLVSGTLEQHDSRELVAADPSLELAALSRVLERVHLQTRRHADLVAAVATALCRELGLSAADALEVRLAALLHDVGKIRAPLSILNKRGPLDAEEEALMRLHPSWGAEIVARIPGLAAVALIVALHHERPDGDGYPYGLGGARIPLASRVVSVCDAYDAMTSGRPYKPAMRPEAVLEELRLHAGSQFEAEVVEALGAVEERVGLPAMA